MKQQPNFTVRQADSMHAKVYLAPGVGAIVGSANLSGTALSDSDTAGQFEAAILVRDLQLVQGITEWFDGLWTSASVREITDDDLRDAKDAFDRAKSIHAGLVKPSPPSGTSRSSTAAPQAIVHLPQMPVSPKTGEPLYSPGANRDVFEIVAMRAGGATVSEIHAIAKSSVALEPVTKHCREDGKRGWCWDLYIDGKRQSVDPRRGFLLNQFKSLPTSARIQLSNFRHAKRHADSRGWT